MSGSIRERYLGGLGSEEDNDQEDESGHYLAFKRSTGPRREEAILVQYEDGQVREVLFYNYLIRAFSTDSRHVTLTSTEGVYLITGDNLTGFLEGIQDRKIRRITGFNAAIHTPQAANAPVIHSIEYLTNEDYYALLSKRDEVRPPVAQAG